MIPDTKLGGKVSTINEVFNDKRQRRTFSSEFKIDAASLVLDQGYFIPEAANSMGVGETALRR
ncbi:transposase [Vibrio splendidus]|uniref:transposase n=1 Tax=Vibrio splendidus TaxID=29497 RepID=UPI000E32822C